MKRKFLRLSLWASVSFILAFLPVVALAGDIALFFPPEWQKKPLKAKAIAETLARNSGLDIHPRIAKSYPQILEAFAQGKAVLAYVGSFVQGILYARGLSTLIAQAIDGTEFYTSVLIVPHDAGDDPVAIVKAAGTAVAYALSASSGESGAKAATGGKAAIRTQNHFAAANLIKIGKAKAAFVKNWWWETNKDKYPELKQLDYPGVSDHRHPGNVLSANKSVSLADIDSIKLALQKSTEVFEVTSFSPFDPAVLKPTLDLMKKGGIDPMNYSWE